MPASPDFSARHLFDEADNAVFKACKDAGQLPAVETRLGQVYQLMQSSLRPGEPPQTAISDSIERIRKTVWHVTLLINYYENLQKLQQFQRGDLSAPRAESPAPEAAPCLQRSDAQPHPAPRRRPVASPDRDAPSVMAAKPLAAAVEAEPVDVSTPTDEQVEISNEATPQDPPPKIVDLNEIDRSAIINALRQGPTSDRRSYFAAVSRQKATSVHRLLIERFNVDAGATQDILEKLINDGSVEIRLRGVAPTGKIQPCVVVI